MSQLPACTIASNNYLAFARVFAASYQEHHPGAPVVVCVVDRPDPQIRYERLPFTVVFAHELEIPAFLNFAFRYDILELNTAVKPYLLAYLRDRHQLDRILYFDPDVLIHDTLTGIGEALATHQAVLTPHITHPLDNRHNPAERKILISGIYNLGFLGLRLDAGTAAFLDWWQERLYRFCLNDPHHGLFVDQGWMNFAGVFLDQVAVMRDPIYNVAYWNLPYRRPEPAGDHWEIDGRRVGFFHFSGIGFDDLEAVSRHQDRFTMADRPELRPLFADYRDRVFAAGHPQLCSLPYRYGFFRPGSMPIPWIARRTLQRIDPEGRRWPDPFEIYCRDSYFSWLTEPVEFAGGVLNRCVLALWEERPDVTREFRHLDGKDLERYVVWLKDQGGAEREKLPDRFLESVTVPPKAAARLPYDPLVHPYDATYFEHARNLFTLLDLRRPGPLTGWLNEPAGTEADRPVITRLAMLFFQMREDLQAQFPDPLGGDQAAFAEWFCRWGSAELDLAPELIAPVRRSLARGARWRSRLEDWRRQLRGRAGGPATAARPASPAAAPGPAKVVTAAEPEAETVASELAAGPAVRGLNLVGKLRSQDPTAALAPGILAALRQSRWPVAAVAIDEDLWGKAVQARLHHPEGAPYPLTLIEAAVEQTPVALRMLPIAATTGSYKIAYWTWDLAHFPLQLVECFRHLDEVWTASRFCVTSLGAVADVPVRLVEPCVPAPAEAERRALGLEQDRFYFYSRLDPYAGVERQNPFGALRAFRRFRPADRVGLVLEVAPPTAEAKLLDELRRESRDLPVVLVTEPLPEHRAGALLAACDALLSLHRAAGFDPLTVAALQLGKAVVATAYGGVSELVDETTGFPVDYRPVRIGEDSGPWPDAVWAEPDLDSAVAQMERAVADPEADRRRAAGRRLAERFGIEAAAERFERELERVHQRI